jgi:hypothetical protein
MLRFLVERLYSCSVLLSSKQVNQQKCITISFTLVAQQNVWFSVMSLLPMNLLTILVACLSSSMQNVLVSLSYSKLSLLVLMNNVLVRILM